MDFRSVYELPYGERAIIDAIVRHIKPALICEFGTFSGATTVLLANAMPDGGAVHTIDLPDSALMALQGPSFAISQIGAAFRGSVYEDRITFHRSAIRDFDFSPFRARADFVFIDASHTYEDVLHDSRRALEIVAPKGVIVWDDYQVAHWDSVRALNKLAEKLPLERIASSRFVLYRRMT